MQWLLVLETENDLITMCRVMNTLRRKGLRVITLSMATEADGYSVGAVVDSDAAQVDHIFNFLRRTEGVRHVTWYGHEAAPDPGFVLPDADRESGTLARLLKVFPGSRVVFANSEKYLLEIPADATHSPNGSRAGDPGFLPFAQVKSTRREVPWEPVGTSAS